MLIYRSALSLRTANALVLRLLNRISRPECGSFRTVCWKSIGRFRILPAKALRLRVVRLSVRACIRPSLGSPDRFAVDFYTVRQKKEPIFFCVHLFSIWRKLVNVFTYVRPKESRSIIYNSVYLILACAENFTATVTLYVLCWPVEWWNWWLPASVYSFNFIITQKP